MADYDRYPNDERGYERGRQWNQAESRRDFDRDELDNRTAQGLGAYAGGGDRDDYNQRESRSFGRAAPRPSPRGGTYAYGAEDSARGYRPSHDPRRDDRYESYAFNPYDESFAGSRRRHASNDSGRHRGFWEKAQDEVSSWMGDHEALHRREQDVVRAGSSHQGKGPKGYRRSDERIRDEVSDRLSDDHWLDASDIEVKVENGEVTLSGTVQDRDAKRRAENLAESSSGVTHVQNNLRPAQLSGGSSSGLGVNTKLDDQAAGRA